MAEPRPAASARQRVEGLRGGARVAAPPLDAGSHHAQLRRAQNKAVGGLARAERPPKKSAPWRRAGRAPLQVRVEPLGAHEVLHKSRKTRLRPVDLRASR